MKTKVEEIVKGLIQDRAKRWKSEEIEEYLHQQEIEIDEKMMRELLNRLSEDDIWKWFKYIGNQLPKIASIEEIFLELLEKIARKVRGNMAQGPFIGGLINTGSKNVKLGLALFEQMFKRGGDLVYYASFPLGGAGTRSFEEAFQLIKNGFESADPNLKATCIRALRVIFEKEKELKHASEIFQILDKASEDKEDIPVRNEAANVYIDFSRFDPDECTKNLIKLARQGSSDIRLNLAYSLQVQDLARGEDEIEILKICAQDEDERVLWRVSIALAFKGKEYPEETLEIVKDWVKKGKYFDVRDIEYCLREIGKGYLDRCIKVVEDWMKKEKDKRFQFFIPIILKETCSSNYGQLIESVKIWLQRDATFQRIALKTIRAVLTEIYPPKTGDQGLVNTCFSILEVMAEESGLDVGTVIQGEPEKFFQCFKIIEALERSELDFSRIYANLESYPTIKEFLGERWFQRKKRENNKTHPLLVILSHETPSKEKIQREMEELRKETDAWLQYLKSLRIENLLRPIVLLNRLEEMLGVIVSKSNRLRDLRDGLENENQFWQTVSEIEIVSSFMSKYPVEIAPRIDGKKLDARIEINGKDLLVEIINPEMLKPLRYLTGKTMGIANRARGKIYDEFKKHLKDIEIEENTPVIIVIDIRRSEIDYEFVEDYLMGTQQLVMLFDKRRGEAVKTYPARAKDFMHVLDQETDVISGVLCYRRSFDKDNVLRLEGRIILNKYAKNPLNPEVIEKIKETLFG